ncbi:hypothetical protein GQ55_9G084700 [Panicum hallii var. hallii]|uniref:Uncharacterized protein n=1 Tax=Panicum hallii var. hallii TaxID=1504633 RepID=A0A2T7C0Z6_9POAL|nr:hypothetical protein GQ55_9G084700 [Panicum hallii var. hallii]
MAVLPGFAAAPPVPTPASCRVLPEWVAAFRPAVPCVRLRPSLFLWVCGWWQPANKLNTAADHGAHPSSVEGVLNLYQFLGIAEGQSAAASDRIGAEQQKTIRNTTGPGLNRRVATTATLWN